MTNSSESGVAVEKTPRRVRERLVASFSHTCRPALFVSDAGHAALRRRCCLGFSNTMA